MPCNFSAILCGRLLLTGFVSLFGPLPSNSIVPLVGGDAMQRSPFPATLCVSAAAGRPTAELWMIWEYHGICESFAHTPAKLWLIPLGLMHLWF